MTKVQQQENKSPSGVWYLLPIFLGMLGGIIGFAVLKDEDRHMAKDMIKQGAIWSGVWIVIYALGWKYVIGG